MTKFDRRKLREIEISQAGLSKLRLFPKAYPYAFWIWQIPKVNRQGAMVCFRGDCRSGSDGFRDVKAIHWWMAKFIRTVGGTDGLVVDMGELFGDWHDRLTFVPGSISWPDSFRVMYHVFERDRDRAFRIWGEDLVCIQPRDAVAEMDEYLRSLPAAERQITVESLADGLNAGLPPDQIDELVTTSEQPIVLEFFYRKADGTGSRRRVTVQHVTAQSIRCIDHKDGKTKNFRLDRISNARHGIGEET